MSWRIVAISNKLVTLLRMPSAMDQKEAQWLLQEKYHGIKTPLFDEDLKRLESGEPLAYVIGWVDFLGCRIDLSARPLIPRTETEFWVERAITEIKKTHGNAPLHALDLFSGSGCIGIALTTHLQKTSIDFGEKDPTLCEQIKKNLLLNTIDSTRTCVIETDVFSNITSSYEYIFANPPYIDPLKKDTVENSVLLHEPPEALFADEGGLVFIQTLLTEAPHHLKHGGMLFIEFGESQKEDIVAMLKNTPWESEFLKDQFGKWRVAKLTLC